jgi:pimeloyl-ACP methyl ester carboxylesterase
MPILENIKSPTLLIVGGNDKEVLILNKEAKSKMNGICELKIVNGASHLFEESGALDIVALQTANWLNIYLDSNKDNHV